MGFSSRGQDDAGAKTWDAMALEEADRLEQQRLAEQAKVLGGWEKK